MLSGIRLIAVPSMLIHGRLHSITIFLQLFTQLFQMIEIFLLFCGYRGLFLCRVCLSAEPRRITNLNEYDR